MLKHLDIWSAIDRLAQENGLTASGLARRAGLDPTTFNRSKRMTREGKPRWPSTESIAKVLTATGVSLGHFVGLVSPQKTSVRTTPLACLRLLVNGTGAHFDAAGCPVGSEWDEIPLPDVSDPHAYAVEINGTVCEPVYRDGDIVIVSPGAAPRRGDRVLVRTAQGDVLIRRLLRQTSKRIELQPLDGEEDCSLPVEEVASLARIIWASQ